MTNNSPSTKYKVLMSRLIDQPNGVKIKAIQLLLLSELNYLGVEEVVMVTQKLLEICELDFTNLDKEIANYKQYLEPFHKRLLQKIDGIGRDIKASDIASKNVDEKLDMLTSDINKIGQRIVEVGKLFDKNVETIEGSLNIISDISELHQLAMYSAVEIMIQRLLESLNPEASENYMDNSVIKLGPLKKAAMFNALQDKYEQVSAYQKEGKMLRDFKVHYKSELKAIKKGRPN